MGNISAKNSNKKSIPSSNKNPIPNEKKDAFNDCPPLMVSCEFEVKNGFVEMKRNVILPLLRFISNPLKMRVVMAMSQEVYRLKLNHIFKIHRWENKLFIFKLNVTPPDYDYLFKIILIGDSRVGKSSILSRYDKNEFDSKIQPTIGVELTTKFIRIDNNKMVRLQVLDATGQNKYRAIVSAYYRGAVGALIVYDVNNRSSFDNVSMWMKELRTTGDPTISVILVGNKNDLCVTKAVTATEAAECAAKNDLLFIETSGSVGTNVDAAFHRLVRQIFDKVILGKK